MKFCRRYQFTDILSCIYEYNKLLFIYNWSELFMTLKTYILAMVSSTLLCFFFLIFIINSFSPESAGAIGIFLFFLTLLFFLVSLFTLCGFFIRRKNSDNLAEFRQVSIAFRQGVFFALVFCGLLFLQSVQLLFWWSAILFIISVALLEFYFINKD